jgi:hypothetical protein
MSNKYQSELSQFFCTDTSVFGPAVASKLTKDFVRADRIMLRLITFYWLFLATLGGYSNHYYLLGYLGGGLALMIAMVGYHYYKGTYINRILIGCVSCVIEVIYIQQELGSPTSHLVYFISLGFLLIYRDGFAAASSLTLVMVHHFTATYCESAGIDVLGMPILAFNWGRWDAYATHLYWAVLMAILLCFVTYNSMREFLQGEAVIDDMQTVNRKLDKLVAQKNASLNQTANEIEAIFANISQAVLVIDDNKAINPLYSAFSTQVLATDHIAKRPAMAVLFTDTDLSIDILSRHKKAMNACLGSPLEEFVKYQPQLIHHCCKNTYNGKKYLDFCWQPIVDEHQRIDRILVSITDSTAIKELEEITIRENLSLKMIASLLGLAPDEFFIFVDQATVQLQGCSLLLSGPLKQNALTNVDSKLSREDKILRCQNIYQQLNNLEQQTSSLGLDYLSDNITAAANYCASLADCSELDVDRLNAELVNAQQILQDYVTVSKDSLNWTEQTQRSAVNTKNIAITKHQADNIMTIIRHTDTSNTQQMHQVLNDVLDYLIELSPKSTDHGG